MKLHGRVALVLGAIKGIGKGIALALAQKGVKIAATYYDWEEEFENLQKDWVGFEPEHMLVQINLREVEKIPELVQSVIDRFGRLDILINKDAPFMTGSVLRLDGGYVLGGDKIGEMPEGVI
jgi:3-oxoacyl-[acyl-carrier protein] reductase